MDTDHREHSVMVWGEPHIVTVFHYRLRGDRQLHVRDDMRQ